MGEEKKDPLRSIKKKIDKTREKIENKPERSETTEKTIYEPSIENTSAYVMLPEKLRKVISKTHKVVKEKALSSFENIKLESTRSVKQFVSSILPSDEKIACEPLHLFSHSVDVENEGLSGHNTEVYTTEKRLVLVNYDNESMPGLKIKPDMVVSHVISESCHSIPVAFKNISNIRLKFEGKSNASALIRPITYVILLILGILGVVFGFLHGIWYRQLISMFIFIVGVFLIVLYFLLKSYKANETELVAEKFATIYISILDPLYSRKSILKLVVDTSIHDLKFIVDWIKKLEDKCSNIV